MCEFAKWLPSEPNKTEPWPSPRVIAGGDGAADGDIALSG